MITTILSVLGWVGKHFFEVAKWFGPAIARLLSKWWAIAGLSLFAISTWALSDWNGICSSVAGYIDSCTSIIQAVHIETGVSWIDGFIGFLALDQFASYLIAFLAFFLPLVSTAAIGIFVSIVGFALKLIVYKITTSATRDFGR